jgi:hypothetical protein
MMNVEQSVECELAGETEEQSATLSTTNPTWPEPGSNPGHRSGKPVTNRLSYGTTYHKSKRHWGVHNSVFWVSNIAEYVL